MKNGLAKFRVAGTGQVGEALRENLAFAREQFRNGGVLELREKRRISGEVAAVEQRNRKFEILRIEAVALGKFARGGAQLHAQIPNFLRELSKAILKFALGALVGVQKQQIDIGVGEQPLAAKAAERDQRETGRTIFFRADVLIPKTQQDRFDDRGAAEDCGATVAGGGKIVLNARRLLGVEGAQFAA